MLELITAHWFIVLLVVLALAFDFLNGLHDAANSIATVVSTRLLNPLQAVCFAAFFNFTAYWLMGLAVANTIGKGIIDKDIVTPQLIFGALVGAMFWNVLTWLRGIPSSSSHALIGGLVGAGVAKAGFSGVIWSGLNKSVIAIFLSPMLGMLIAMLIMLLSSWSFRWARPQQADGIFKVLHLLSSAAYSISHGANDAQKTMGIITVLLYSGGLLNGEFAVPGWVVIACYVAIALGTLSGGWKIIQTMGTRITRLTHHTGFAASTAGSIVVFTATAFGIPVSTTHTITGSVIGAGAAKRASGVRWELAGNLLIAWIITIPCTALIGALFYWLAMLVAG
jgi:PiT family inorganic phosphate transporter